MHTIRPLPDLTRALARLHDGQPVAIPTETIYGLAADACNKEAVARVFALKGRPSHNPLIIHVSGTEMARKYVRFTPLADALAARFWPGPLTLVLPKAPDCPVATQVSAGGDTLAVRCPSHPVAHALIAAFGGPLAAPSANKSGRISPTSALHVAAEFPHTPLLIVDGGSATIGLESTVVDATGTTPHILRPGSITAEMLGGIAPQNRQPAEASEDTLRSPGLLSSHYAPTLPLRLHAISVQSDEALLAFGPTPPRGAATTLNLSVTGNLEEAATHLYAYMRQLDQPPHRTIAVMPIPHDGIGIAINDRLMRAATQNASES